VKNVTCGRFTGKDEPAGNDSQRKKKGPCADVSQRTKAIRAAKMSPYAPESGTEMCLEIG
jgi:hypothetical protein